MACFLYLYSKLLWGATPPWLQLPGTHFLQEKG